MQVSDKSKSISKQKDLPSFGVSWVKPLPYTTNSWLIISETLGTVSVHQYFWKKNENVLLNEFTPSVIKFTGFNFPLYISGHFLDHCNDEIKIIGPTIIYSISLKSRKINRKHYQSFFGDDVVSVELSRHSHLIFGKSLCFHANTGVKCWKNVAHIYDSLSKNVKKVKLPPELLYLKKPKMIFLSHSKQLVVFGAQCNNRIFYCMVDDSKNRLNMKYSQHQSLKIPHVGWDRNMFDILTFRHLVFIFYWKLRSNSALSYSEIWCLDFETNLCQKCQCKLPNLMLHSYDPFSWVVRQPNSDLLHLINFVKNNTHICVSIYDIIGASIMSSQRKLFAPLINGFIRKHSNDWDMFIPSVLYRKVLEFFPFIFT